MSFVSPVSYTLSTVDLEYHRPRTLEEALHLLAAEPGRARLLAGGTDLIVELRKSGSEQSRGKILLMDIGELPELREMVAGEDGKIRIGAAVTHSEIVSSPLFAGSRRGPGRLLAAACSAVGSPQIRNRGTIGGNIANASPSADTVPALVVLGARVLLRSESSERRLPVEDFIVGPYATCRKPDEIICRIELPPEEQGSWGYSYQRVGRRNALSISRLSVACAASRESSAGGKALDVRIAPGSVTERPRRLSRAEEVLRGELPTPELIDRASSIAADEAFETIGARWSTPYKRPVLRELVKSALSEALGVKQA